MNDETLKVLEMVKDLPEGTEITIPGRGGWECILTRCHQGFDFTLRCPEIDDEDNPTDRYKFFSVHTRVNPYGAPLVIQEPTLGVACRFAGVDIDGRIVGAIVLDAEGKVMQRFSWSKLVFVEKRGFGISSDGCLLLSAGADITPKPTNLYLRALFLPDKNRLDGYVGVFGPTKPQQVKVLEMEDLLLSSL